MGSNAERGIDRVPRRQFVFGTIKLSKGVNSSRVNDAGRGGRNLARRGRNGATSASASPRSGIASTSATICRMRASSAAATLALIRSHSGRAVMRRGP